MKQLFLNLTKQVLVVGLLFSSVAMAFPKGRESAEEVLLRFRTERLTETEKIKIINSELKELDLHARIEFYTLFFYKIEEQNLSQNEVDSLVIKVVRDLENLTTAMDFSVFIRPAQLYEIILAWAFSETKISKDVATEVLEAVKKFNWLSANDIGGMIYATRQIKTNNNGLFLKWYAVYEQLPIKKTRPDDKKDLDHSLLAVLKERSTYFVSSFDEKLNKVVYILTNEKRSYTDRYQAIQLLLNKRKIEQTAEVRNLAKELELGSLAEKGQSLDDLMKNEENILHMSDLLMNAMLNRDAPQAIVFQRSAVETFIKKVNKSSIATLRSYLSDKYRYHPISVMAELQSLITMSEEELLNSYLPYVQKSGEDRSGPLNHREWFISYAFKDMGNKVGMQKIFMAIAESMDANATVIREDYTKEYEGTEAGKFLQSINRCVHPGTWYGNDWKEICDYLSPKAIFLKVADNPNMTPFIKAKAKELAESHPY